MNYTEQDKNYLKTLSVLLVEDDDSARNLLSESLGLRCGTVISARNGSEGLDLYTSNHPDIVVTDIQMPVMDGLRMAEEIHTIDKNVPIIVTTAFEQTDYFQRSIEIGIERYVLKPIMLDRLNSALLACAHRLWLEEQQQKLAERVRQTEKIEAIGQLTGGVAHHFNNILQVIGGYSEMSFLQMSPDDPNRERMTTVMEATNRAARITQGLLAFSCKLQTIFKHVNISDIMHHLELSLSPLLGEGVRVQVTYAEKPLLCNVDQEQIELVVTNLVSNACNAMKNGGVLSIQISSQEIDTAFIQAYGFGEPGHYALLSVSDTGTGMDKEILNHIFNPFYTTREIGQGTGLGLPMSLGIVKTHHGFLNVESEPGQGTTIRIYLPVINPPATEPPAELLTHLPPGGTETILVVDDSIEMLGFMSNLLNKFGYQVLVADTAGKAIEIFAANRQNIGIVVTDMFMHGVTGNVLTHELKQLAPDMKFLFSSGYSSEIIQWSSELRAGEEIISKPFRPYDLLKKIREILDRI